MVKQLKDKGYILTELEFKSITKQEDGNYFLPDTVYNFSKEDEAEIDKSILNNISRPTICKNFNVPQNIFDRYLDKRFKTKKISHIREILLEKKKSEVLETPKN